MQSLLLHICCAPCFVYPFKLLKEQHFEIKGFFYNPNIHPSTEFMRRRDTLKEFANKMEIDICWGKYDLTDYFSGIKDLNNRCYFCYLMRLEETVKKAKEENYQYFSTTLLYSKRQKHDLIKSICEDKSKEYGVKFYYYDFRDGWKWGIEESKRLGMYRQNYCGCVFSEKERFFKE